MSEKVGAIDAWATLITPERSNLWPDSFWHIFKRYGVYEVFRKGKDTRADASRDGRGRG